ncbi:MAG: SGNH/GDSL hydrolase family protein [Acidobacteria bacterium]|nr:SGNH/GDSL hydrolase family protein [Acidobacteriota bacterium]
MKTALSNDVVRIVIVLLLLLGLKGLTAAEWPGGTLGSWNETLFTTMANRDLNKEAREALTAGYYEGLINEGSRLSSMNRLVTDTRRPSWEDRSQPDRRQTFDFMFYELIPNSDIPDYQDERFKYRLRTNSAGLADQEYALEKPAGTRRLAIVGDSITRGQGAPFQGNYEALLERRLNEAHVTGDTTKYEILNFAIGSYNVTQMMEAAIVRATPYQPDVYVVALSDLSVYRRWDQHIAMLVYAGIDLKYDYLKDLIATTGLSADDPIGVFDAKLSRYRIPTIQWALEQVKQHADAQGADMVVLLVPTADDPALLAEEFLGVREMLDTLGVPVVDLLGTFDGIDDRGRYRVSDGDRHPNAEGHQLLYEGLYERLQSNAELRSAITGTAGDSPSPARTQ